MSDTQLIISLRAEQQQLRKDLAMAKGQMQRFSKQTQTIAARIQTSLAVAFGGFAAVEGLRTVVMTMADFEFQMDKVAAISGASKEEVAELTKNARELGAVSKFTATEIGKLQEELARLGFTTDQIISMTDASRQLATVADVELGQAAKVVGQQLKAFNLEASESGRVANVIAESFSKSALDMEKFEVAMSFAGAAGKAFGQDIEQTVSQVAVLIDRGIQASKAGTALRTIFIELSKSGMSLDEALKMINESENKLNTSSELFGKTAANQALILAENQEQMAKLNTELSDGNREMQKMVDIMEDNLITSFAKFRSAIEETILKGGVLGGWLKREIDSLTGYVVGLNTITELITGITSFDKQGQDTALILRLFGKPEELKLVEEAYKRLEERAEKARTRFGGTTSASDAFESIFGMPMEKAKETIQEGVVTLTDEMKAQWESDSSKQKMANAFDALMKAGIEGAGEWKKSFSDSLQDAAKEAVDSFKTDEDLEKELNMFNDMIDGMSPVKDELAEVNESIKEVGLSYEDLEKAGANAAAGIASALFDAASGQEGFAQSVLSTGEAVVKQLLAQATAALFAGQAIKGLPGIIAAAAGIAIMKRAFKDSGTTAQISSTSQNLRTGETNTFNGTLRFVGGAGELWGILEDEKNKQGLRGG